MANKACKISASLRRVTPKSYFESSVHLNSPQVTTDKPCCGAEFRNFLDGQQYRMTSILRYERIFGAGFVSTGGLETTKVRGLISLRVLNSLWGSC